MITLEPIQPQSGAKAVFDLYCWSEDGRSPVREFICNLQSEADLNKLIALLDRVATHGLPNNPEKYKKLNGYANLHELKSDHIRMLFFIDRQRIIFTEAFMKTKSATDTRFTDRADRRRLAFMQTNG